MVYLRAWPQEGPCVGVKGGEGHEFGELQGQVSAVRGGGGAGAGAVQGSVLPPAPAVFLLPQHMAGLQAPPRP